MDKQFWISIAKNDYNVPDGHHLDDLTTTLFGYLSSTDPELRDEIAYIVYANWLKRQMYTKDEIRAHVQELLANLERGIGARESDSVFLRAFSVLFLAEIVHNDNKKAVLDRDQVQRILAKGLWYLNAEKDPRGYVPVKGWAHALAHTADLMLVLGSHRHVDNADLQKILDGMATKVVQATDSIYIHGEDERLAAAVLEILRRNLLSPEEIASWTKCFTAPDGGDWKGAYVDEDKNRAFQNTRNLLRSIYLELATNPEPAPNEDVLKEAFFTAVRALRPY